VGAGSVWRSSDTLTLSYQGYGLLGIGDGGGGGFAGDPGVLLTRRSSTTDDCSVAKVVASWADSTHATRTGQLSLGAYYTGTLQTGLTVTARSSGFPYVSAIGSSGNERVRLYAGDNGDSPYLAVSQVGYAVDGADVRLGFLTSPKLGLYRFVGSTNYGSFLYYDINTGDTVVDCVYAPGGSSIQHQGTQRIRVDATGIGFYGVTPVSRAAVAADATDLASALTLVNDLKAKLVALGLVS